jgi:alpha-beta hydrolase superfamily lysophospholipase
MSLQSEYIVVICHGPYLSSASYAPLINGLKSKGIKAYCPQLATNDTNKQNVGDVDNPDYDREPPQGGYPQPDEDIEIVLSLLRALIKDQGRRVLLVAHSTGSFVAAQAAQPELQEKARKADGLDGGILGILHFGGFVITVGQSITSFFQRGKMEWPPKTLSCFQYHVSGFRLSNGLS